ncbi:conserved hypothetical protein [Lodderomyces elongisporus NRRL YB-4239]|uniref:DBF4-type domain-containing protein n=1 Tax=Lodderomyces elongisporus (strain ATCC 11503 / CBS 2605 / JCM 1781 / NBRC 1676 / NRRL YB-4239) TaxID=379508 RepID=A5E6A6_LODEL|nr:conserved hypothetical protein [Lodderomyces elongisporus NRRL YB-4239]
MESSSKQEKVDQPRSSDHDIFKKKFTSLSRPRQPLRETNSNLPKPLYKPHRKSYLPNKYPSLKPGNDQAQSLHRKLKSQGRTSSPSKEDNKNNNSNNNDDHNSSRDKQKVGHKQEILINDTNKQVENAGIKLDTETKVSDDSVILTAKVSVANEREKETVDERSQQNLELVKPATSAFSKDTENARKRDREDDGKETHSKGVLDRCVKAKVSPETEINIESEMKMGMKTNTNKSHHSVNNELESTTRESTTLFKEKSTTHYGKEVFLHYQDQTNAATQIATKPEQQSTESLHLSKTAKVDTHAKAEQLQLNESTERNQKPTSTKVAKSPIKSLDINKPLPKQSDRVTDHKLHKLQHIQTQHQAQHPAQQQQQQQQQQQHSHVHVQHQQQQKANGRLSGDELYQWQQSWRKIMRESTVFFEGQHDAQLAEFRRATKLLKYVGCEIAPFYGSNVTIIISKRTYDDKLQYPPHDIFCNVSRLKVKVWNYDKLFRFMKNLGLGSLTDEQVNAGNAAQRDTPTNNLYNLLKEEKIYGSADRDPNARRDDFHYFGKNYLYVYDLSQAVRPIAVKEWGNEYPTLNLTLDGKCPFIYDPSDQNSERKRLKRMKKFEASKAHRQALKAASHKVVSGVSLSVNGFTGTSTSTDKIEETSVDDVEEVELKHPLTLTRNSSCIQSKVVDNMASGYYGASNALQFSMDSALNSNAVNAAGGGGGGGNGLGPIGSQVPSRNLNNLKRRIFMKRKMTERKEKETNPGYCENCRVKYDHFDDHIHSNRHRNFACDDRNFKDIDELILTLQESRSFGHITSNGDYV